MTTKEAGAHSRETVEQVVVVAAGVQVRAPCAGADGRLESGMRVMAKPSEMEHLARKNSRRREQVKSNTKCALRLGKVKIRKQAVAIGVSKARMLSE